MTLFWFITAAMAALALAFVLPPILRGGRKAGITQNELNIAVLREQLAEIQRDLDDGALSEAQFAAAKKDLERELFYDLSGSRPSTEPAVRPGGRWAAMILLPAVPLLAFGLYQQLGASKLIPLLQSGAAAQATSATADKPVGTVEEMVAGLAARLERQPDDLKGWTMLGRSYMALSRWGEAATAYARAVQLSPNNATLMAGQAEAMALSQNGQLTGESAALVAKALQLEPNNPTALWLNGNMQFRNGNYAEAIAVLEKLSPQLTPGGKDAEAVAQIIREAQTRLGIPVTAKSMPAAATVPMPAQPAASPGGKTLSVTVNLAPSLAARAAAEDTVFVYARAAQGPRMPLAIVRKQVKDLPLSVTLDDSMAMSPAAALSKFPQVVVSARISKSGNAMPQSGDLSGTSEPVAPGQPENIAITIDSVTP